MENDMNRFGVGETVVKDFNRERPGIIDSIRIVETREIDRGGVKDSREVNYGVFFDYLFTTPCKESTLSLSEKQLHEDAFRVQTGQVILLEGEKYVVEDARLEKYSTTKGSFEDWRVEARELFDDKYNSKGKFIKFYQERDRALDIVGSLEKVVDFK